MLTDFDSNYVYKKVLTKKAYKMVKILLTEQNGAN